ncbi:MAG TPA: hypothetical protein VGG12_07825 [Methylovirgula sp.]
MIDVKEVSPGDPMEFEVVVREPNGETRHRVTLTRHDAKRLASGREPKELIEAAFRFLLDRESKQQILTRFDISVIARYFPDFERVLPRYLER